MKKIRICSLLGCVVILITLALLRTFPLTSPIMVMNLLLVFVFGFFVSFLFFAVPETQPHPHWSQLKIGKQDAMVAASAAAKYYNRKKEKDKCQFCLGTKGGKPGNENMIDGVITCDCCQSLLNDIDAERDRVENELREREGK